MDQPNLPPPLLPDASPPDAPPTTLDSESAPAPAPAPATQSSVRLDIEVPEGANVGDRLTFNTDAGQFSLVVPPGAAPGKKMMVTMPVPASFPPDKELTVSELRINGNLPQPKFSREQLNLRNQHLAALETHWCKFAQHERRQVSVAVELTNYKPQKELVVLKPWGFWTLPTTLQHVPAAAEWEPRTPKSLSQSLFSFLGARWELSLDATPSEAQHGCTEIQWQVVLRRLKATEPGDSLSPISFWAHLELADRWSTWHKCTVAPGEAYVFDVGDRRDIHTHAKWQESTLKGELRMTAIHAGAHSAHQATQAASTAAAAATGGTVAGGVPGGLAIDPSSSLGIKRKLEQSQQAQQQGLQSVQQQVQQAVQQAQQQQAQQHAAMQQAQQAAQQMQG